MSEFVRSYRGFVFAFGVLVFLLRPFMGYMLTTAATGFTSSSQSLQRLVKKKDEHMETVAVIPQSAAPQFNFKPLYRLLTAFFLNTVSLLKHLHAEIKNATRLSEVSPDNHRFRRCLAYRI